MKYLLSGNKDKELEKIRERMRCENCQTYDVVSKVCKQNGCNNYADWVLWMPTTIDSTKQKEIK